MQDHVSWGFHISNFTFLVGMAAAAVILVMPAYVLKDHDFKKAILIGEAMAVSALLMAISFVVVVLGGPDRLWHLIPGIGIFHWPNSMLAWDILVLNGYLILNLLIQFYILDSQYCGRDAQEKIYVPAAFPSILRAVSVHLVTAFLCAGLPARPFWNTALMGPRFLATAFTAGPALMILVLAALRRHTDIGVTWATIENPALVVTVAAQMNGPAASRATCDTLSSRGCGAFRRAGFQQEFPELHRFLSFIAIALLELTVAAQTREVSRAEANKVHRKAILIDGHNDVTSETVRGLDLAQRRTEGHTDIPRMREGGMGAQFFAAYVSAEHIDRGSAAHRALQMIDTIRHDIVGQHPEDFQLALRAEDIAKVRKRGRIAALIGVEGGHAIEDDPRVLRTFYDLGARYMTLTHTRNLSWAGSSGEEGNAGLSELGRKVIAEMNRLGMMVDIAHVSDRTFWDVIEASKAPVFSSHSSCRALSNIPRNMTDEMIQAVARKGGLVMINFGCEFLSQKSADTSPWTNPTLGRGARTQMVKAKLADVVAHIDHVKKIAGIDAVGLGSDFDGVSCVPEGLEDVSRWPNLTKALLENGYSAADIRKVYGGNLLRFMKAVERAAAK